MANRKHKRYYVLNLDVLKLVQYEFSNQKGKTTGKIYPGTNFNRILIDPPGKLKQWKYGFKLILIQRELHLFAFSEFDRDIWLKAFQALFRLTNKRNPGLNLDPTVYTYDGQPHIVG